jgi:hypothetical protein
MIAFYEGLLFNKKIWSIRSAVYMDKKMSILLRKILFWQIVPAVETFEKNRNRPACFGMPFSNTKCKTITDEISIFIELHFSHFLLFFSFFRSFRATLISLIIVIIGVWSFGF